MFPDESIYEQLGIPKRIFVGEPSSTSAVKLYEEVRLKYLRESVGRPMVLKALENVMPEMFWEVAFVMSPGIKVMRRRELPTIYWE